MGLQIERIPTWSDNYTYLVVCEATREAAIIDAPEADQTCADKDSKPWACGQEATFALLYMIGDHWITCKGDERDRYGRLIAVCYAGPYDLNAKMVRQGWALAYRRYSMDYVDAEAAAKEAGAGMWRGKFVLPWEWRRKKL